MQTQGEPCPTAEVHAARPILVTMPMTQLPPELAALLAPLFKELPLERAMEALVVKAPAAEPLVRQVEALAAAPALLARPDLAAGLWLYVDDLDRSHRLSQALDDATGSYWHA